MGPPAGKEPQSRPPTWPRRALTDQPRDKNNAIGEGLQHLDSNQVGHSGVSQKKLPFSGSADLVQGQNRSQPHANAPAISKEVRQDDKAKIIMVVDDSQTVRNIMALILHRAGYRSVRVASAMEALHTLRELIPDLIFLDITLPGMDGLDVCKIIKENPRTKQVPVIMLSGNNEVFDKVMGRLAGASDYITKPFEPEIILNCIRSFLGQKKSLREGLWQGTR
jgi:CheY-like chemotaxis protein